MINRRTFIRSFGTGIIGLGGASVATGDDSAVFVVSGTEQSKRRLGEAGFELRNEVSNGVYSVTGPVSERRSLERLNGVETVVSNVTLANPESATTETDRPERGPPGPDAQWDKKLIDAFAAHEYATGEGTRIAIVDTGIDHTHPDLGNVNTERSVSILGGETSDHVGDVGYHGTHCAGIAGATGDTGIVGVAPETELVSIRVFGFGGGTFEDLLLAIEYATEIEADVVNLSLGSDPLAPQENAGGIRGTFNPVCRNAARNGTVVTTSVGNDGVNLQSGRFVLPTSAAGTLSVSATGRDDELAYDSNYGTNVVDIAAPGGGRANRKAISPGDGVLSTVPSGWTRQRGTSMAAPQVAGLAALVRERDRDAGVRRVSAAIERGAEGPNGRGDPELGAGRIDALETVKRIRSG